MKFFISRYLDPASRLGEILFGLIMVLSITLATSLNVEEGKLGVRQLLFAAIGCNLAWGIIDGVMYLMNCLTVRRGKLRLVRRVQKAKDPARALEIIRDEVEPELQDLLPPEESQAFSRGIHQYLLGVHVGTPVARLTKDDFLGALACFWLVFFSCLPAALPFFLFSQPSFALRVSNFLLLTLLFLVGQQWAQYSGTNRWLTGAAMVGIGLFLVGLAILFGG